MKPLSCPSQFILPTKGFKNNFQLSHKCPALGLFAAAAATVHQHPHFWRTEHQELFAFLFAKKIFGFEPTAMHDPT